MLTFFTDPYEDEILHSIVARYHYYTGNINLKDTSEDLFGYRNCISSIEFPSRLNHLLTKIDSNNRYNSNYIINNHTVLPYYIPFLSVEIRMKIENDMKYGDGSGIYTRIGMVPGSICSKQSLEYCPICAYEELEEYGEAYFHRVHQLQGVMVCPQHGCLLNKYIITKKQQSRLMYTRLDYKMINTVGIYEDNDIISSKLKKIAEAAKYLLDNDLRKFDKIYVNKIYKYILRRKGLINYSGSINQEELYKSFKRYYGDNLLDKLESNIYHWTDYTWLSNIARKPREIIHPLRNILFILFLCDSIEEFFNIKIDDRYNLPFGEAKWPCLNKIADHYKQDIIECCDIKYDYKSKCPIGTFKCSCGFIYSRSGEDKTQEDRYRIGYIKDYGYAWKNKLRELLLKNGFKIRKIGRLMGCDSKTVLKYAKELDMVYKTKEKNIDDDVKDDKTVDLETKKEIAYKNDIINITIENPEFTRTQIRNIMSKQYIWLYRRDKDWLYNHLPACKNKKVIEPSRKVDWIKRDNEILIEIKKAYSEILNGKNLRRITKSYLGRKIGKEPLLFRYIDRLPLTKEYIENITETIEEFQIRRVDNLCNMYMNERVSFSKCKIERKAGLKKGYSKQVESKIYEYIRKL